MPFRLAGLILVLILKELHDSIDAAVAEAYGWRTDLDDNEILTRLVDGGTRPQPVALATTPKPPFPTDNIAQTAAIMARLGSAPGRIDPATITAGFRQGRRVA